MGNVHNTQTIDLYGFQLTRDILIRVVGSTSRFFEQTSNCPYWTHNGILNSFTLKGQCHEKSC